MSESNNIKKVKLVVRATPGASDTDCIKEAIKLSIDCDVPVELIHNEVKYNCDSKYLTDLIFKAAHNQTEISERDVV